MKTRLFVTALSVLTLLAAQVGLQSPSEVAHAANLLATSAAPSCTAPAASPSTAASSSSTSQHIAIPSYICPGLDWTRMAQGAPTVGMTVINPNSGPGSSADPSYVATVQQSQAAGQTVLGYVHTSDGSRSLATVEAEIDTYFSWYHVDGIFVDEVSTDCSSGGPESSYYQPLYSYIKAKTGKDLVVLNPGTATDTSSCYMSASDVLIPFEGDYSTYQGFTPPSWMSGYAATRFWHLIYGATTTTQMLQAVHLSKQDGAGWVYVTPNPGPGSSPAGSNPWGSLPSFGYWAGEVAAVNAGPGLVNAQSDAGAVGDGSTDDTAALQKGFSTLGAAGGVLYLPAATYSVAPDKLAVPSNVSVVGDSAALKVNTLGFSSFDIQSGATTVGVAGVTVDGNNLAVRGMTVNSGASNVYLADDTFQNFTQPNNTSTPRASSLFYQAPAGVQFAGNTSNIVLDGTTIQNVVAINTNGPDWPHKVARGLWLDTASGQTISQNDVVRNSTFNQIAPKDDGDCIVAQGSTANANLTIDNNTFNYCHKRAIKIQVPGVTVTNNTITNPFFNNNSFDTWPGPFPYDMYSAISAYASNVTVSGNQISGVGSFYAALDVSASECSTLSNISITNNSIQMGSGAYLTGASLVRAFGPISGFTVTGNTLDYAGNGIVLFPGSTNVTSSPNTVGSHVTIPLQTYGQACLASLGPQSTTAGSGDLAITITGTGFASDSTVQWNGNSLPTTYNSPAQLTATIPAADLGKATTASVAVLNPSTGGLVSDPLPFYVTQTGVSVSGVSTSTSSASVGSGSSTITAAPSSGAGTVSVGQYSGDPVSVTPPTSTNAYFDVYLTAASTSSGGTGSATVTVTDCDLNGGTVLYWYNSSAGQWQVVSPQTYAPASGSSPACITTTITSTSTSSPAIADLTATPFAVGTRAPLTVTASSATMTYGDTALPSITPSYNGFVGSDSASSLVTPPTCGAVDKSNNPITISSTTPAGTYTTTCWGAASSRYAFIYKTGTLTVKPAPLTITASNATMTYGGTALPGITPGYSGLKNGATAPATPPACGTVATTQSGVGSYRTYCQGAADGNYSIRYLDGTLIIKPASARVSVPDSDASPIKIGTAGGTASVPLTATLSASQGDLTTAAVTLTLTPLTSGGANYTCTVSKASGSLTASGACSSPALSGTGSPLTWGATFTGVAPDLYKLTFSVGGNYTTGSGSQTGVVTVYDPSLGYTVGGGTFTRTEGTSSVPVMVGFYAKNVSGQIAGAWLSIEQRSSGDVVLQSTGLTALTIVPGTGTVETAYLQGKATNQGTAGYTFLAKGIDADSTGPSSNPDQYGQQLKSSSGTLVSDLSYNALALTGGDIVVP